MSTKTEILQELDFDILCNDIPWTDGFIEAAIIYSDIYETEAPDDYEVTEELYWLVVDFKTGNNEVPNDPNEYRKMAVDALAKFRLAQRKRISKSLKMPDLTKIPWIWQDAVIRGARKGYSFDEAIEECRHGMNDLEVNTCRELYDCFIK